ncbi:MAG: UxaA family hydrolase [Desulfovibrio sp.]|jgi:altronate dehydratase small subunit|nr:UxaA family hydrolase [Desulfovibrio sp.]
MISVIVMNVADNVGNAIVDLKPLQTAIYELDGKEHSVSCQTEVPYGFKIAVRKIPKGEDVVKYAEPIGIASRDINEGECVHVHNIMGKRGRGDLE